MQAIKQYREFANSIPGPSSSSSLEERPKHGEFVEFEHNDPLNPKKWSARRKVTASFLLSYLTLSFSYAAGAAPATEPGIMAEFHTNEVMAVSTTGLFLIGLGLGALPAAPLSELYGRLPIYVVSLLISTLFTIGCALAPSISALMALRFFAGLFSAAPLSNAGGSLLDVNNAVTLSISFPLYAFWGFSGPIYGPLTGGFIADTIGWRWCYWVTAMFNASAFILVVLWMPETNGPVLLRYKAVAWRRAGRDVKARLEIKSLRAATQKALQRPFKMLVREPAVQLFTLYLTIIYIALFGFFAAYPRIFAPHGLGLSQIGLVYIPLVVGFATITLVQVFAYRRYKRLAKVTKVEPEERLLSAMAFCITIPGGLFWLAWTSDPRYSVWLTMMGGIFFAIGSLAVFIGSYEYIIDAYGPYAASALADLTLFRYVISGCVMFAFPRMYETLGNEWATSLLGFLGVAMCPVPFVFYVYGECSNALLMRGNTFARGASIPSLIRD